MSRRDRPPTLPPNAAAAPLVGDRLAVVRFAPAFLHQLATPSQSAVLTTAGLPAGAELVRMEMQPDGMVLLIFRHPSFPLPQAIGALPELTVTVIPLPVLAVAGLPTPEETPGSGDSLILDLQSQAQQMVRRRAEGGQS